MAVQHLEKGVAGAMPRVAGPCDGQFKSMARSALGQVQRDETHAPDGQPRGPTGDDGKADTGAHKADDGLFLLGDLGDPRAVARLEKTA